LAKDLVEGDPGEGILVILGNGTRVEVDRCSVCVVVSAVGDDNSSVGERTGASSTGAAGSSISEVDEGWKESAKS
jgi:hypothetical protein